MTAAHDFRACVDAIESGYEYMLAYAAQGRDTESAAAPIRSNLESMSAALEAIGNAAREASASAGIQNAVQFETYAAVLDEDAQKAKAAVDLALSVPSIGSQIVDNLNASIHVRALLTSIFLIDEALNVSTPADAKE